MGKGWDFWAALIGSGIWVFLNSPEKAFVSRILMVISSMALAASLFEDVAAWLGIGDKLAICIVGVFGYTVIDLITAIISDRKFIKALIEKKTK